MKKKSIQLSLNFLSIVLIASRSLCSQEQPQSQFPLHDAAKRGDLATVMSLCEQGVPMDAVDYMPGHGRGVNPLHVAANCGHLPVVQFLAGIIDVDATDAEDQTPFFIACERHHFEVAKYLYTIGANVNLIRDGYTALHFACNAGNLEFVQFLTRVGLYHTRPTDDLYTPLDLAVESKNPQLVSYLCLVATNEDIQRGYLEDALCQACYHVKPQMAKILIQSGANVNAFDEHGRIPLLCAVSCSPTSYFAHSHHSICIEERDRVVLIKYLLSAGARIDAVDDNGDTAFHEALFITGPVVIKLLWNEGAH